MGEIRTNSRLDHVTEKRRSLRRPIYVGEGLNTSLSWLDLDGNRKKANGEIVEISAEGLTIAISSERTDLPSEGKEIYLSIEIRGYQKIEIPAICVNVSESFYSKTGFYRIGFSYLRPPPAAHDSDRRTAHRFLCNENFQPIASCHEAIFFHEPLIFRVHEVSSKGAKLRIGSNNINIIPGLKLNLKIQIPGEGSFGVDVQIVSIKSSEEFSLLEVGTLWMDPSSDFITAISDYLFSTCQYPLRALAEAGLIPLDSYKGLIVTSPSSRDEWTQLLNLRLMAYHQVGKFGNITKSEEMLDQFDAFSRQLICKAKDKIVGSVRIVFVNKDKEKCEHHLLGIKVPDWLWEKGFVEISRLCTHSDYRSGDILPLLVQHMGRVIYQAGYRYLLSNCNDNMWPVYRAFGWKKTGVRFGAFGTNDCNLLTMDLYRVLQGNDSTWLGFNLIVSPMVAHMKARGFLKGILLNLKIFFHGLFHRNVKKILMRSRQIKRLKKGGRNA